MSGGGGGSSGQVAYPEYIQQIHSHTLDHGGTDFANKSVVDALNTAAGNSPYAGVTAVNPDTYLVEMIDAYNTLDQGITALGHTADYQAAYATALALYTLDTSPLESATADSTSLSTAAVDTATLGTTTLSSVTADTAPTKDAVAATAAPTKDTVSTTSAPAKDVATTDTPLARDVATLDTAPAKDVAPTAIAYTPLPVTPDTIDVDETAIQEDVDTYAAQLRADIENNVLPRYKAGMLNVNAITSSAFVIGEALIWAEYDRNVARYAAELRSKIFGSNDQYTVQLKIAASTQFNERVLQAQRLTAQESLSVREENKDYALAYRDENRSYKLAAKDETKTYNVVYREDDRAHKLAAKEETKSYNLAFRDENKLYKLAEKEEGRAYSLAFRDENKTYKVVEKEETRSYNLAFREENRAYKLAASQQNAQFKLANTGETKDLNITYSEQTTRLKLAASDQNSRFKLANTDETVKLKLAASEQNMRFKLQKNELDASHKLNRQKNILMATAELVRLLNTNTDHKRVRVEVAAKVAATNITSKSEELHEQLVMEEADIKWDLELFQYVGNLMAAVSGGTGTSVKKTSKAVSALGGALSGAAMGAAVGGPYAPFTAAAGAVIGGAAAYLQ